MIARWFRVIDGLNNECPVPVSKDSQLALLQEKAKLSIFTDDFLHRVWKISRRKKDIIENLISASQQQGVLYGKTYIYFSRWRRTHKYGSVLVCVLLLLYKLKLKAFKLVEYFYI